MRKAIYLKQYLFETNSHYEKRVNNNIVTISEKHELVEIETGFRQTIIFFETDEKVIEKPKRKVSFPITSNNY